MNKRADFAVVVICCAATIGFGDVLFGPVVVEKGSPYSGTFGMYCRCTAYFVEARNGEGGRLTKECTVVLNGETVLDLEKGWSAANRQVELRETQPNEIEIEVKGPARSAATVSVYERDVTPAPMVSRVYKKKGRKDEEYRESFVLNHWASRFWLDVINGEEDGSGRVESGIVEVNGVELIGEDELHDGVYSVRKEVELQEGMNVMTIVLEGDPGSKIQIGIEEAAQTVMVTEVAQIDVPKDMHTDGIGTFDGEILYTACCSDHLLEIDGQGEMREFFADSFATRPNWMSPRGGFVLTMSIAGEAPIYRLYDHSRTLLSEFTIYRRPWEISENGSTIIGADAEAGWDANCGGLWRVYDSDGTSVSVVPSSEMPLSFDRYWLSPDGEYVSVHCNNKLSLYSRDGALQWETTHHFSHELANNGMAVQASRDTLYLYASDGSVERMYVNSNPLWDGARTHTTPDGGTALHIERDALLVGKRWGPQSCWKFEPGYGPYSHVSEDGRWVLVESSGYGPGMKLRKVVLLGAGGQILWEISDVRLAMSVTRPVTAGGFYFIKDKKVGPWPCHVFRIDVE